MTRWRLQAPWPRFLLRAATAPNISRHLLEVLDVARSEPPQVLISDYSMPGLTGLELAQDLALLCPQCSVILLSALDLSFIQTQSDKFPMPIPRFTFFRKPVAVRTLLDAIRQVLDESVV
jgi:DNA-binding NtrC family response regulator